MFSKLFSKQKTFWMLVLTIIVLTIGGYYAYQKLSSPADTAETPTMETARIGAGDITLIASGTGSLIAATERSYAFETNGTVANIYVAVGDTVEAGQLLANLDDSDAQDEYDAAKRAVLELTSDKAIAQAFEAMNTAEAALKIPREDLIWMLSETLFYSEERLENAQILLADLKESIGENPTAEEEAALKEAQLGVRFAEDNLVEAQAYYEEYRLIKWGATETVGSRRNRREEYVTITDQTGETYYVINGPTDEQIAVARAEYALVKANLLEAQWYYAALTGEELPEEANSADLVALEQAYADLENATAKLEATQLIAPISGTITSLDFSLGEVVDTSTNLITIADLTTPYLEIYMDETDWNLVEVGNPVQVTFDALPDETFNGEVLSVEPSLYTSQQSSYVRGIAKLAPFTEGLSLPVGSSAAVEVIGAEVTDAVLVPIEALHQDDAGEYSVYVVENDEPVFRTVEIGLVDILYAEVLSGLEVGDTVVTANLILE